MRRNFAQFETSPRKGQQKLVEEEGNLTFPWADWQIDRSGLIAVIVYPFCLMIITHSVVCQRHKYFMSS